jgi:hypothetical protein
MPVNATDSSNGKARWNSIEELCEREFGKQPSASNLSSLKRIENERAEVREFIDRVFRLMAMGRFDPADMTPALAWTLAFLIPGVLPGAWGGSIPPWTFEGRHHLIDAYLISNPWMKWQAGGIFLEMGCGFPPQTAIDAARSFPDWQVIGADPHFDPYVLYDDEGSYACLDLCGAVRFFHASVSDMNKYVALYRDPASTFRHFEGLFRTLLGKLPPEADCRCATAEKDGARLIRHPIHNYECANLRFIQAGVGAASPQADIVRCFNVLVYFDGDFRRQAEHWALRTVRPGGLFLCGVDGARTLETRYSVYKNEDGQLVPKEFAFSLDNVRPTTSYSWHCLHDGEKETWALARLVGILRSDPAFCVDFDNRLDDRLAEKRIWVRSSDGYLAAAPDQLATAHWTSAREEINAQLDREGFADRAVSILDKAGYRAWRNPVGHIAVHPNDVGIGSA